MHARQLNLSLRISNPGPSAFTFTAALHTYLRTPDIGGTLIQGLVDLPYLDSTADDRLAHQAEPDLFFSGEVDRIYLNAPSSLTVRTPASSLSVAASGFPDVVVWTPWREKGAALTDLEPEGYRLFVCLEAAVIGVPVSLAPGETWQGAQHLLA